MSITTVRVPSDLAQLIVESSPAAYVVVDAEGSIVFCNARTEKFFGYSREELIGQPMEMLIPERLHHKHREYRHAFTLAPKARAMGVGRDLYALRKDGSQFPVEVGLHQVMIQGAPLIVATVVDISERRLVQEELRAFTDSLEHEVVKTSKELEVLRTREAEFGRILERSLNEIYIFDAETLKFVHVNKGARENTGYTKEELANLTPLDLKPKFTASTLARFIEPLRTGEAEKLQFTTVHRRKDGSLYPVEVHLHLSAFESSPAFVAVTLDITERKRTEDELRESEEQLKMAQRVANMGFWTWDIAKNQAYRSEELYSIFGVRRQDFKPTYEGFLEWVHPDDRDFVRAQVDATARGGSHSMDYRIVRPSGEIRYIHEDGEVTGCVNDTPVQMLGTVVDITERKRTEEELRRSEANYRELFEHATYGIYRSSPEGRFLAVNPALVKMLGYESEDELLGVEMSSDLYATAGTRFELIERLGAAERIDGVEVEWRCKDGGLITVRLTGRPVRNEAGDLECFEMIVDDVTEQHRLEARLRQAQKMEAVGQLTGGIAHDFNNLLTVIMANLELAATALPREPAELWASFEDAQSAAQRGSTLVKKLLGFSRRERLKRQPVDLAALIGELLTMLRRVVPESIDISFQVQESVGNVLADSGAVEQMVLNLVTNARDAMPDGGELTIEVKRRRLDTTYVAVHPWVRPGEYISISVTDTGVGMDEATKERVFEPFFTTKAVGTGTGLGMGPRLQ